jgi:hypothetical protein
MGTADAHIEVEGRRFSIYVHSKDNALLLQPKISEMGSSSWGIQNYRAAAEQFVKPVGCGISAVEAISVMGGSWEATYVCPESINLRALVKAQRSQLVKGVPLHLSDPVTP